MNIALPIDNLPPLPSASEAGPPPKRIVVGFGFWVFLLSDIVMFSALFAAYAVLVNATAGGPSGAELFNQTSVAIETACLLASSYTCGLMSLAVGSRNPFRTYLGAAVTFVLGAAFLTLELSEFAGMIAAGATSQRSAQRCDHRYSRGRGTEHLAEITCQRSRNGVGAPFRAMKACR